ncbi:MAG: metallophosphoesterase family protein [Desulfosporosinus sp.]|jgi:hypothetical protein
MDSLELTPWPFRKQTKNSMKSIDIPRNARVKYYKDLNLIYNLYKHYQDVNIPAEICYDKIASLPVLVVYHPGETIYFVHTDADFSPIKHAVLESETPRRPALLLADSSISLDKQYIRNGEPVKIRVFLTKALHNVSIRVFKVGTQSLYYNLSSFPRNLPQGETVGIWDGKVGDDGGVYSVILKGAEDNGFFQKTRIIKSVYTVEIVDDRSIRLGCCPKNGRDFNIYAQKLITETAYQDEVSKELALKQMIIKAIEQNNQTSSVIINIFDNGPGTSGKMRLMNIEFAFTFRHINSDGILNMTPPTVPELERLRGINTRIERIITSDFIQVCFQGEYKRADLIGREIILGREELARFNKSGKIKKYNFPKEKLKSKYEAAYSLPATLTNYLKLRDILLEKGFTFTAGNFNAEVSLRVYPNTSRQKVTWITFTESESADTPEGIAEVIINCQKDQMRIISPLLTSTAMLKQSGSFTIYLDIPNALIQKSPPEIGEIVADKVKMFSPLDKNKPFQNRPDPENSFGIRVVSFKKITKNDPSDKIDVNRLYKGTINTKEETRIVRDPTEQDRIIVIDGDIAVPVRNPAYIPEEDYQVYLKMYLRKYPGILDECENLYRVELKPNVKLQPGIYLLKVTGSDDEKVHPVMVFADSKDKYNFSQITDVHLAQRYDEVEYYLPANVIKHYANPNKSFISYAQELNKYDFVVITGDLVEYANDHRPYENDFIRDGNWMYTESIIRDNFSVPVFVTPGNHDYRHNTVALSSMTSDLNLTKNDAQKYPYDTLQDVVKWGLQKCLEDSLYYDENALQYYFYNFCPFYDYSFQLDNLSFIFLDSKTDSFAFMNDYPTKDLEMTAEYVASILLGSNPAPMLTGLLREQLDFVDSCLDNIGILFMHSALINVPSAIPDPLVYPELISRFEDWNRGYLPEKSLDEDVITAIIKKRTDEILMHQSSRSALMAARIPGKQHLIQELDQIIMKKKKNLNFFKAIQNGGIYYDSSIYLGKDKTTYFDESSVTYFRDELIKRMKSNTTNKKRIKLAVVGHVHKNLEFKLKSPPGELEQMRWYCGEYACRENENKPLEDAPYTVATVSGGYLGYRWIKKADAMDSFDIDSYKKEYYGTGYRDFCITADGVLESMKIIERLK